MFGVSDLLHGLANLQKNDWLVSWQTAEDGARSLSNLDGSHWLNNFSVYKLSDSLAWYYWVMDWCHVYLAVPAQQVQIAHPPAIHLSRFLSHFVFGFVQMQFIISMSTNVGKHQLST